MKITVWNVGNNKKKVSWEQVPVIQCCPAAITHKQQLLTFI